MDGALLLYHHPFLLCGPSQFKLILLDVTVLLLMSREKVHQKTLCSVFHTHCQKNTEPKISE